MATFNVLCSNRFLLKGGNSIRKVSSRSSELNVCVATNQSVISCRRLGGFGESRLGVRFHGGDSRNGFTCSSEIKRLMSGSDYGDKEDGGRSKRKRRRFSLRLRPRLRLVSMRLGRFDFRASIEDFRFFLKKNLKRVILSTGVAVIFGICYLFLRLTAVPSPSTVPYSDFVTNLRGGSVSKVLLEEGSRRIYYNTNDNVEDVHKSETLVESAIQTDDDGGGEAVAREDIMEAIERAKYGINDKEVRSRTLGNELSKLFPWMPSLARRNGPDQDGLQGPLGYQSLS